MTAPLPPNILGTGVLPSDTESRLLAAGALHAYHEESATPGKPPVLIVYYRDPKQANAETGRFLGSAVGRAMLRTLGAQEAVYPPQVPQSTEALSTGRQLAPEPV
jgi:hypothetical protein